jgi:hypothetical protein
VEVLVAAVIFAGVFLLLFTILGNALTKSSSAEIVRVATIADLWLARFHERIDYPAALEFCELDGVRFRIFSSRRIMDKCQILRLAIGRAQSQDTIAVFFGIRYETDQ